MYGGAERALSGVRISVVCRESLERAQLGRWLSGLKQVCQEKADLLEGSCLIFIWGKCGSLARGGVVVDVRSCGPAFSKALLRRRSDAQGSNSRPLSALSFSLSPAPSPLSSTAERRLLLLLLLLAQFGREQRVERSQSEIPLPLCESESERERELGYFRSSLRSAQTLP